MTNPTEFHRREVLHTLCVCWCVRVSMCWCVGECVSTIFCSSSFSAQMTPFGLALLTLSHSQQQRQQQHQQRRDLQQHQRRRQQLRDHSALDLSSVMFFIISPFSLCNSLSSFYLFLSSFIILSLILFFNLSLLSISK